MQKVLEPAYLQLKTIFFQVFGVESKGRGVQNGRIVDGDPLKDQSD
jgi:hypothetical protein